MSANKDKGNRWERQSRDYLVSQGIPAYRPKNEGFNDVGDIHGVSPFILQAKDWRNWQAAIREGLDGAQAQKGHAGEEFGAVIVKRARANVSEAYVVMRFEDFAEVLRRLRA